MPPSDDPSVLSRPSDGFDEEEGGACAQRRAMARRGVKRLCGVALKQ
jgi:hypothetical protein